MALVAGIVQLLVAFFKTSLASFVGAWRLRVVILLTGIGMVISGLANGQPIMAILFSAAFLALVQVGVYEFSKNEIKPKLVSEK